MADRRIPPTVTTMSTSKAVVHERVHRCQFVPVAAPFRIGPQRFAVPAERLWDVVADAQFAVECLEDGEEGAPGIRSRTCGSRIRLALSVQCRRVR